MKLTAISRALLILSTLAQFITAARAEEFTLFVYETPSGFAARTDAEKAPAYWGSYGLVAKEMTDAGILRGGSALHADDKAKVVQVKAGVPSPADGAAAKSPAGQMSGYFIIDVADVETALKWAAKIPAATTGLVEVRPHFPNPLMAASK